MQGPVAVLEVLEARLRTGDPWVALQTSSAASVGEACEAYLAALQAISLDHFETDRQLQHRARMARTKLFIALCTCCARAREARSW